MSPSNHLVALKQPLTFMFIFTAFTLTSVFADAQESEKDGEAEKAVEVKVKGQSIKVPYPAGLLPKKKVLKSFTAFIEKSAPTNTLHEVFATPEATEKSFLEKGITINADVQTVNAVGPVAQATFNQVKVILGKQFGQILKQAAKEIKDRTGADLGTNSTGGKFVDEDNRFAFLIFSKMDTPDGQIERASASCLCFLHSRLVLCNLHKNKESDEDVKWVKAEARKWMEAICEANKPVGDN